MAEENKCPNYVPGGKCMSDKRNGSSTCCETYLDDPDNCPYQD